MKIRITYEYDINNPPHFFAKSTVNGVYIPTCGDSWEQARSRHLKKLEQLEGQENIPPPEEIDTELLK
jgi:hypothetical protein